MPAASHPYDGVRVSVEVSKPNPCRAGRACLVVWDNGKVEALPDLPKASTASPVLFTNTGRIFGWVKLQGEPHAVLWTKTG